MVFSVWIICKYLVEPKDLHYRGAKILRSTKDFSYLFGVGENGAGWVCPGGSLERGKIVFFLVCLQPRKWEKHPFALVAKN